MKPNSFFKTLFCLLSFILVVYLPGCKKENALSPQSNKLFLDSAVQSAKKWYEAAYPLSSGRKLNSATGNGADYSQTLKPDWYHSKKYVRFDDDVIETSMDNAITLGMVFKNETDQTPIRHSNNSISRYILLKQGDTYKAYIMTVIASPSYLGGDITKLDRNSYSKRDSDFSGSVVYLTPKGGFVSGWIFEHGKLTDQIKKTSPNTSASLQAQGTHLKPNMLQRICVDWYYWTYYQKEDGTYSEPEEFYGGQDCYYIDSGGGGGGDGGAPSTGGSNGGGGNSNPNPPNPCNPNAAVDSSPKIRSLTINGIKVNKVQPVDPTGGDGGFPPPEQTPCPTDAPPPKGFRPLCKGSINLKPYQSGSSQVNMAGATFGIMDEPHFPLYTTQINVIEFNLFISIPNQITNPDDRSKTITFTSAQQKEFVYQAYHYASQMTNLVHGQDFFSAGAQPKYSTLFAGFVQEYLNSVALQGMFPSYESHNGGVPSMGARASTLINPSLATPAQYTDGNSGEGC